MPRALVLPRHGGAVLCAAVGEGGRPGCAQGIAHLN